MKWALLFEDVRYQVLRQTTVAGVMVSTVWLGIDPSDSDPPRIFETMLFGVEREEQYRYSSEQEALAHHEELLLGLALLATAEGYHGPSIREIE